MPTFRHITRWQELTTEQREMAYLFLQASGPKSEDPARDLARFTKANRATSIPVAVLRQIEMLERGEMEDPDSHVARLARLVTQMPEPPPELLDPRSKEIYFVPDANMTAWMMKTFVARDGVLRHDEHAHLAYAPPAVLWTNAENSRARQRIAGTASMPKNMKGDKWAMAMKERQYKDWFGQVPEFLITLDALLWESANFATRLARTEHEMLHCGHSKDEFGCPKYSKETGRPLFYLRGHDVEVFTLEWERYGPENSAGASAELFRVSKYGPTVSQETIHKACGTC